MDVRVHVTKSLGRYDFIFGRDYLTRFGIDLRFNDKTIEWDAMSMPMHAPRYWSSLRKEGALAQLDASKIAPEDVVAW